MRIDSSLNPSSQPERSATAAREAGGTSFGELLESFTRPEPPAARSNLPLQAPSPFELRAQQVEVKAARAEVQATHAETEELRREDYLNGLDANQDHMEDLVEDWKDRSPHKPDPELEPGAENTDNPSELDAADLLNTGDDIGELISDFDELPLDHDEQNQSAAGGGGGTSRQAPGEGDNEQSGSSHKERDMSYQEIQALVETALSSGKHLPPRVKHILQELLNSLLEGQRWLLDQHRLIGLEREEWDLIQSLFPAHFYAGLLRQQRHGDLPLYDMLQQLYEQIAPAEDRRQALLKLWQPALGDHLLLRNWVLDQPMPALEDDLNNLLELWQHHNALPPGATGRTLQLALAYRHHPERMQALFLIAGTLLHGKALTASQRDLLAGCIAERCFPRELTDTVQMQDLLISVLSGQEPSESELMQLLQGCNQGLLSYLPYAGIADSLRDLKDYVRRDLLGREELVPTLLREEELGSAATS